MNRSLSIPPQQQLTNVIAVIGCDGSGKSTLSCDLLQQLDHNGSIELVYLGQSSGNIKQSITNLPLIGPALGRYLVSKAKKVHNKKSSSPDMLTTIVIYLLSLWRAHKFRRMLRLNRRGVIVITDRFPQAEVAGFYFDGTGLGVVNTESWLAGKLAAREKRLYEWMASHLPALIIRLNIDADTAHSRKPDHKLSMLQDKIAIIPKLHFNHAQILDLDSRDPYQQVLSSALKASNNAIKTIHSPQC